jgi:siroheme synthase
MPGTLFVVATPIGNLEDITLRALRVLREANLIAAEDTRRTAKLLSYYGIHTPTLSFHAHNSRARLPQLIVRLTAGETWLSSPTRARRASLIRVRSSFPPVGKRESRSIRSPVQAPRSSRPSGLDFH